MNRRVVVTGTGIVSPIGNDVPTFWKNLLAGVCGIDHIKSIPTDELPVKVAGEVKDFNASDYGIEAPFVRKQDRFTVFAVAAAKQAMDEAGLTAAVEGGNIDPMRLGVYVGSGIGGFTTQVRETEKILSDGPKWVSPLFIPTMIANIAAGTKITVTVTSAATNNYTDGVATYYILIEEGAITGSVVITGTPRVVLSIVFLKLPTPEPGVIPVSVS